MIIIVVVMYSIKILNVSFKVNVSLDVLIFFLFFDVSVEISDFECVVLK